MPFTPMLSSAVNPHYVSVGDSFLIALIGLTIVFVVLIVLMLCIQLTGKIIEKSPQFSSKHPKLAGMVARFKSLFTSKRKAAAPLPAVVEQTETSEKKELAPGSCGNLTLINTEERDAAMIMAIVADALDTPLNELRFLSIKRIG